MNGHVHIVINDLKMSEDSMGDFLNNKTVNTINKDYNNFKDY